MVAVTLVTSRRDRVDRDQQKTTGREKVVEETTRRQWVERLVEETILVEDSG